MIRVASNGKIDENRARPREGSVAISKTGDNPVARWIDAMASFLISCSRRVEFYERFNHEDPARWLS